MGLPLQEVRDPLERQAPAERLSHRTQDLRVVLGGDGVPQLARYGAFPTPL